MKKKNNKAANAKPAVKTAAALNDKMTAKGSVATNGKAADGAGSAEMWQGADESSMIREQERQARDKKKKKHRRKKQIAAVVVIALAVGGIWYAGWGRNLLAPETQETVSISAGFGQEIIYAQLTAVRGNEITYTVATPIETNNEEDGKTQTSIDADGQMPEGMTGQMPGRGEGGDRTQSGESSEAAQLQGKQSQNMSNTGTSQNGENAGFSGGRGGFAGSGFEGGGFAGSGMSITTSSAETGFTYGNVTYRLTDESVTTQIPVGTDVTTRLGTMTTFSRLAAGDRVALVVEEEDGRQIIMAVYIIG